jgi:sulfite exporter TauE/SafE/copper chaperone CopZ
MNTYTFHVSGTHCASCKILIEDILGEQPGITHVHVDLKQQVVHLDADEANEHALAKKLSEKLEGNGYTLLVEPIAEEKIHDTTLIQAIPIGLFLLVLFFLLQKSGILNFGIGGKTTPVTSFLVGLIASVSSCLAIVGGLVLSFSAKITEDNKNTRGNKKQLYLFHIGRLASFGILGGVLGLIGKELGVNYIFSSLLGLLASLIMITLGLTLTGIFKKSKFTLPSGIFKLFRNVENHTFTPLLLGIGTFFLPCGFTQSMQVAALSSGTFISGSLIMLFFALGTLPMLSLLSFGSASFAHSSYAPLFFKSAGIVVTGLGIFAFLTGLAGLGIINPLFTL